MILTNNLIFGETFTSKQSLDNLPIHLSDEDINQKYKKGEVRIVTEQARYPLDTIPSMLESEIMPGIPKYRLDPEYQRRKRWDDIRKSRLIESFIMNVPIPPIFLYEVDYSQYEVMDGRQRLTTIYDFYKGEFALQGLQYWQELNGRKYTNLPEQIRKGIDRRYISSIILLAETAKNQEEADELKQIVFERLNTGGDKLTAQEIRNALYNGNFNQLCIKLAKNDSFRKMWHLPLESDGEKKLLASEKYRKMEDVELVLRFFAYRHLDQITSPLDTYLDSYLKQANNYPDETIIKLENLFYQTIDLIYHIFGDCAFLLPKQQGKRKYNSPAKIVYDAMMQVFANNIDHKKQLIKNSQEIKNNLYFNQELLYFQEENNTEDKYLFDTRYYLAKYTELRINYYHNFLQNYLA